MSKFYINREKEKKQVYNWLTHKLKARCTAKTKENEKKERADVKRNNWG